ncbi:Endopeptidase S2P [Psidium guajava]|nr:Endopeptidase S2P [Psidium guajava]
MNLDEGTNQVARSVTNENPRMPSVDKESDTPKASRSEEEQSNSQEKVLKRPDKTLPCPREILDCRWNVPVDVDRRKNKNSASHYRHLAVPKALQSLRTDLSNGVHHPPLKHNGAGPLLWIRYNSM